MKRWFLLPLISAPMPFQMALDEILFRDSISQPILRFFFSSEPWVTVGYSHRENGVNENIPVCKRITGGGRVEHGSDLIFSIIARKEDHESFKLVRISYLKIHEAVKAALEQLGFQPRFYRCDENLPAGQDCFRFPIATDLAVGPQKIAGGAQKRSAGVLLHQESIQPLKGVSAQNLIRALRAGYEKIFDMTLEPLDLNPEVLIKAEKLAEEKYGVLK